MSTGFELATSGTVNMLTNAAMEGKPAADLAPSAFEGAFKGVGMGIMRGGAQAARAVSLLGAAMPIAYDKLTGGTAQQDDYFRAHDRFKGAVDFWTPKPHEVGAAGRIVGGLAEMISPLMATGGNPALLIANAQANTGEDLVDQGVNAPTARAAGTWQALATGVGFQVPMLGKTLAQRVMFGAASNPAIGAAGAAGTADLLEKGGFEKQAKQFDAWDVEARATDTLIGMFFGGVVHYTTPKGESRTARIDPKSDLGKAIDAATPTERDALLTQQLAAHAETSASPGKPRSMDAKNEHVDALTHALDELDQGKTVSAQADPAQFDPVPARDQHRASIERTVEAEGRAIGATYDTEMTSPHGDVNDPAVFVQPEAGATPVAGEHQAAADVAPGEAAQPKPPAPEVAAAHEAIAANPELHITLEDGSLIKASDAMRHADELLAEAEKDGKGFDAAVSCFLKGGR